VAGVGIRFSDQDQGVVRRKIEDYLAGMLTSNRPTCRIPDDYVDFFLKREGF